MIIKVSSKKLYFQLFSLKTERISDKYLNKS